MAKIGTDKHPAVVRVATEQRALEIMEQCDRRGIKVIVGIEPGKQEDITDVERILRRPEPVKVVKAPPRITGNDYCPCGSGKKYKKCCGASSQLETRA
jgi:preprotein translocase subunit SecA